MERDYDKIVELMKLSNDVSAFEFEGVIFKGYRPDSVKQYVDANESRPFYIWLHDTHQILVPSKNVKH